VYNDPETEQEVGPEIVEVTSRDQSSQDQVDSNKHGEKKFDWPSLKIVEVILSTFSLFRNEKEQSKCEEKICSSFDINTSKNSLQRPKHRDHWPKVSIEKSVPLLAKVLKEGSPLELEWRIGMPVNDKRSHKEKKLKYNQWQERVGIDKTQCCSPSMQTCSCNQHSDLLISTRIKPDPTSKLKVCFSADDEHVEHIVVGYPEPGGSFLDIGPRIPTKIFKHFGVLCHAAGKTPVEADQAGEEISVFNDEHWFIVANRSKWFFPKGTDEKKVTKHLISDQEFMTELQRSYREKRGFWRRFSCHGIIGFQLKKVYFT